MNGWGRAVVVLTSSAAATRVAARLLRDRPPGGPLLWSRTNHRGEAVTLLEGPAFVLGAAAGLVVAMGVPARVRWATTAAVLATGALGAYDDLAGDSRRKGLAGHLGALARGDVTTGAVKVLGLAATGLVTAAIVGVPATGDAGPAGHRDTAPVTARLTARLDVGDGGDVGDVGDVAQDSAGLAVVVDTLVGGAVVAGAANLLNLLDLRPGRALKVTLLLAVAPALAAGAAASTTTAVAASTTAAASSTAVAIARVATATTAAGSTTAAARMAVAAAAVGAAVASLPGDLAERSMLGDTGANAAGALLGVAALAGTGRRGRLVLLAGLTALTLASEKVSFTRVIETTPVLRELDALGRRPPG